MLSSLSCLSTSGNSQKALITIGGNVESYKGRNTDFKWKLNMCCNWVITTQDDWLLLRIEQYEHKFHSWEPVKEPKLNIARQVVVSQKCIKRQVFKDGIGILPLAFPYLMASPVGRARHYNTWIWVFTARVEIPLKNRSRYGRFERFSSKIWKNRSNRANLA